MNFQKFTTFKTILIALVLTINANQLFAQTNNGIFFQAVARDNFSNPAKDRKIFVQSSIIQSTPTGTKVLTEEHQANTDATGVFSISLGNGVRVGGTATSLATIDWSKGPFYLNLKVAITPIGGNSNWDYNKEWVDMGTTSFGAVPFALYSASSAKVDDKLNAIDTTKMLAVYAKAIKVQSLEASLVTKLTAADTLTMLKPYAKAAYTIDTSLFKSQLATKLSIGDTILYTKQKYTDSAFAKKLNIADSTLYVTKSQLASYNFSSGGGGVTIDTSSLSRRINLKVNIADLSDLTNNITSNTSSITSNATLISAEVARATAAELVLTNNIASNTGSITSNATLINLKANASDVSNSLSLKADATDVTTALNLKANASDLTSGLALKANKTDINAGLALKLDASQLGVANGIATLNASGLIPSSQLPPVSLSSTNVVSNDVDMVALSSATVGSIAIRTDLNKNFVLSALPASTLGNWVELLTPAAPVQTVNGYTGTVNLSKNDIDLSNVDNTSDISKPVSIPTRAALDLKLDASKVGSANGVASLNTLGKIPSDQIPAISFSSVKVLTSEAEMLALSSAVVGSVVIRTDINKNYVLAVANPAVLSNWIQLLTPAPPVQTVNGMTGDITITKSSVDLANVNNTSDASKPVSTATLNALGAKADTAVVNPTLVLKAPLASPKFTGSVAIGTTTPASSAALDITSTTQGLLLPRLTYVQKTAIANPVAGLILFCSDCGTNGEMQLYNGTSFVNMIGATAQFALPAISATTGAYSITSSTANSGGVINSDGGSSITSRGIVWGTSAGSSTYSVTSGTGVGTFTSAMTGLTSGVTYYVRAYATNSLGTKYGSEISFNTSQAVATLAATTTVSSIGATTATSGGNITYNGGATVTTSGIVWSTTSTPTIALSTKTTNGAANGVYTSTITGLTPGTLYYVRSYATNSVGTSYGVQTNFTTLNTPTISATASATSITSSTATIGGAITSDGGAAITSRGVVYGTSSGSATYSATSGTGTGTYTISLTGLTPATTYFARSFASNSVGTVYGTETNFTTIAVEPTVSATAVAASITGSSATSGGTISSNGGATVTVSGVVWSTTSTPTIALATKTTNGAATGTYTSSLTGLAPATLYYVRAYATNSIGTAYGPQINFTTLAIAPTISATASATSITSSTATIGGTITTDGGAAVTSRGVVYGTSTGSATFSVTSGTGTGTYTISLTGLSIATNYFVRAFATNSAGTAYGPEVQFATPNTATVASTVTSTITSSTAILGGVLSSTGGATTAIGIMYSTSSSFGTYSTTTINANAVAGTYTTTISGLSELTTYYVKSFATNTAGTTYGPTINFSTSSTPVVLGGQLQGGTVVHIFKINDPGYVTGQTHGIIMSNEFLNNSQPTVWTSEATPIATNATGTVLGSGLTNSNSIYNLIGNAANAINLCRNYSVTISGTTYTNWYLPSIGEWNQVFTNLYNGLLPNFNPNNDSRVSNAVYAWTSSEVSASDVTLINIQNAGSFPIIKKWIGGTGLVRAIRYF